MKTPNEQVTNGQVLKFLKDYWFIVAVIFSVAMTWANFTNQIKNNTDVNEDQQVEIDQTASSLGVLSDTYIADVTYIKTTLDEMRNSI